MYVRLPTWAFIKTLETKKKNTNSVFFSLWLFSNIVKQIQPHLHLSSQ